MIKAPIEKLLPRADYSVYKLVRMASRRALELSEGRPSLIEHEPNLKTTTIALHEIADGKVESKTSAEMRSKEEAGNKSKK